MPLPTVTDVHVDAALSDLSVAYMQSESNFIAGRVFPSVPVSNKSDKYFTYNKSDFRRDEMKPRAPGTESSGGGYRLDSSNSYNCETYAYHTDVPDEIRANSDAALDPDTDATRFVSQLALIQKENHWVSTYFTTSVWDTDVVGSTDFTQWSDSSSDPEKDINVGRAAILKSTGREPNKLVVGYNVHQRLKEHPLVQERFKYTSPDSITAQMLARFFEIDEYLVSKASEDTAKEGASDSNAFIAGDHALLCYSSPTAGLMMPSAGYNFVWSGFTGMNDLGVRVKRFRMEQLESDRVEIALSYDMKAVATDMGYFFSTAVA